jgi:pimeloyl-ACP methyl ester carboxylesterase
MNAIFRMSPPHSADMAAVAAHLRKQAAVPVWLVGTSMGTFSAAAGAITGRFDGLVLTSTVTRAKPDWAIARSHKDGVASMALPQVTAPAFILAHTSDACALTPPADVGKLRARLSGSRRVDVATIKGGAPPLSEPCEALSPHGFHGVETQAVDAIARFIKGGPAAAGR